MPVATARAPPAASPPAPAPEDPKPSGPGLAWLDLAVAAVACLAAAAAALWMSPGPARAILAFGVLAVAPGYLLLQAVLVPVRPLADRLGHCACALGVSPAYLGLVALTTTFAPNGFRPKAIVAATLVASLALAVAALLRRRAAMRVGPASPASTRGREVYAVSDGRSAPRRPATATVHPRPLRSAAGTLAVAAAMPKTARPSGTAWQPTLPKPSAGPSSSSASRSTSAPSAASSSGPRPAPSTSGPSRPLPPASSSVRSRSR